MKPAYPISLYLIAAAFSTLVPDTSAAPRHRPGNPRGVMDPRGVLDTRGVMDTRGVLDPRGPLDPRNPRRYMYGLPSGYAMRTYGGVRYYYSAGLYYYPYVINGQTVYTQCNVVNGVPTVPGRPY